MSENLNSFMKNQLLELKLKLLFIISLNKIEFVDNNNNSNKEFQFELDEIRRIQALNNPYFLIFLYINKDIVHNKLYEKDEFLKIVFEIKDNKISQYIYLGFLIEVSEICNYQYSFKLINTLHDIQRSENEKILKKIIMAKVILSLVDNYNQIGDNEDNKDNKHKEELEVIKSFNENILDNKNNKEKLDKLKLEDIKSKKIEEIYLIIIKYLIENSKLEDSDYTEKIINQIELESIILTKYMFEELIKILIKEKEYIKKYEIENFDDIFKENKINFYYNLIRYILKQSLYIYQIPFLSETRKTILNLIKNNKEKLSVSIKKNDYKIEYIIKHFIGDNSYNYYYKMSETIIKNSQSHNNTQQSNKYGANSSIFNTPSIEEAHKNMKNAFESSTNDSSSISPFSHESFKNDKENSKKNFYDSEENEDYVEVEKELVYKVLNKSRFKLHINKNGEIPSIIYDEIKIIISENESEDKTIQEIRNITTKNKNLSNNYIKFLSFLDKFESYLLKDFNNNYDLKITLTFKIHKIDNNNNLVITCLYDLEIPGKDANQFKDENILINGLGDGFQYLISSLKE